MLGLLISLFPLLAAAEAPYQLRVGVILPLSGEAASVGNAIKNGMELAQRKLPDAERSAMVFYFEDDRLRPSDTISAFHRLREGQQIDVAVTAGSSTSKALAPVAEGERVPLVAIATDPSVSQGRRWVVNYWMSASEEARAALADIMRSGYRTAAWVSTIHDFPLALRREFEQQNAGRVQIVQSEEFTPETKDFRQFLIRLRRHECGAVLLALMPGQLGVFAKQARQMGITAPFFGFETMEDSNEVQASEGALIGQKYVNNDDPDPRFMDEYRKAYPGASQFGASVGHDIVLMLAGAARGAMTQPQVNDYLHTVKDFSGAMGTYSADGHNSYTLKAAIKIVEAGGFRKVAE